jgi:hypothetical protein
MRGQGLRLGHDLRGVDAEAQGDLDLLGGIGNGCTWPAVSRCPSVGNRVPPATSPVAARGPECDDGAIQVGRSQ